MHSAANMKHGTWPLGIWLKNERHCNHCAPFFLLKPISKLIQSALLFAVTSDPYVFIYMMLTLGEDAALCLQIGTMYIFIQFV